MSGVTEDDVRAQQNAEPWGKFLIEMGLDPYNTESMARRVAEHAAKRIAMLEKLVYQHVLPCDVRNEEHDVVMEIHQRKDEEAEQ
jgi:hypothetical protein